MKRTVLPLMIVAAVAQAVVRGQDESNTNTWTMAASVTPASFRMAPGPLTIDYTASRMFVPISAVDAGGNALVLPGRDSETITVEISFAEHAKALNQLAPPWPATAADLRQLFKRAALRAAVRKFRGDVG